MPLASLASLQWYGPAAGSGVLAAASPGLSGAAAARARSSWLAAGLGSVPQAKATRLRGTPAALQSSAVLAQAVPKARARGASTIRVNTLSQDDVAGALLSARVEGTLTLQEALRLLLSVSLGNATGLDGTDMAFKSLDGTKTRVAGTYAAGNRTVTARDGS